MSQHLLPPMIDALTGKPAFHPIHGYPLHALGRLPSGRLVWPGIGGAPDDEDDDDQGDDLGDDQDGDGEPENVKDSKGNDLGYPARTKVKDMTVEQQAAYWRHHARTKEDQLRNLGDVNSLKDKASKWDQHQAENATELEKAKQAGREEAIAESNSKAVTAILQVGLKTRGKDDDEVTDLVSVLNPAAFVGTDGDIDTDKIQTYLDQFSGPAKDDDEDEKDKKWPDTGGGRRRSKPKSGVAAGAALFEEERGGRKQQSTK